MDGLPDGKQRGEDQAYWRIPRMNRDQYGLASLLAGGFVLFVLSLVVSRAFLGPGAAPKQVLLWSVSLTALVFSLLLWAMTLIRSLVSRKRTTAAAALGREAEDSRPRGIGPDGGRY